MLTEDDAKKLVRALFTEKQLTDMTRHAFILGALCATLVWLGIYFIVEHAI